VIELERVNAELRVEVKQTHLKIAEAEEHQNSLHSGYSRLEDEGEGLRNATETLNREKVEAEVAHEVEVTGIHTKFQDYRVHHLKKLRGLRLNLEKAVAEFGAKCLPYPGKNSTIGNIIGWFDNEIKALPGIIAKANTNFVCYAVVGVLGMLYDNGCDHIEGLQTIMGSSDASILEDPSEELTKLIGHLVKKWWIEHSMRHVVDRFRKKAGSERVLCMLWCFNILCWYLLVRFSRLSV
jgi:hypothetical protein